MSRPTPHTSGRKDIADKTVRCPAPGWNSPGSSALPSSWRTSGFDRVSNLLSDLRDCKQLIRPGPPRLPLDVFVILLSSTFWQQKQDEESAERTRAAEEAALDEAERIQVHLRIIRASLPLPSSCPDVWFVYRALVSIFCSVVWFPRMYADVRLLDMHPVFLGVVSMVTGCGFTKFISYTRCIDMYTWSGPVNQANGGTMQGAVAKAP